MNKNLAYFALFLILVGVGFGIYLVLFLGVLLLIPALLSPARPPMQRTPAPAQPPRRIIPPTPAQPVAPVPAPQPMAITPMQYQGYTGPLFPGPMFPSLSQMGTPPTAAVPPPPTSEGRDELLEVGAILAALKLLSG